jgi:hypothetical protein
LLGFAGGQVGAAQLHRADTAAVLDGYVLNDVTGQRHGHPLRPCRLAGLGHQSPPSGRHQADQLHERHSWVVLPSSSPISVSAPLQFGHASSIAQMT